MTWSLGRFGEASADDNLALPWGKPPGWPNHEADAEPRDRNVIVGGSQEVSVYRQQYKDKYEIHAFLPLFLLGGVQSTCQGGQCILFSNCSVASHTVD